MNDEEVAFRIVRLYFEEVARHGFKRQLDLDQMINAYFYTLRKLKAKDSALKKYMSDISSGKDYAAEVKEEAKAEVKTSKSASPEKSTTSTTTTTTTTTQTTPPTPSK